MAGKPRFPIIIGAKYGKLTITKYMEKNDSFFTIFAVFIILFSVMYSCAHNNPASVCKIGCELRGGTYVESSLKGAFIQCECLKSTSRDPDQIRWP